MFELQLKHAYRNVYLEHILTILSCCVWSARHRVLLAQVQIPVLHA